MLHVFAETNTVTFLGTIRYRVEIWAVQVDQEYAQDDHGAVTVEFSHHVVHVVVGVYQGEW